MKKRIIAFWSILFFALLEGTPGQQSADVDVWEKDYAEAIEKRAASNRGRPVDDVFFTHPDYVVFIPKCRPDILGDMYNDHFQVFPLPGEGRLGAVWTQASMEGALDQHFVFARSSDKGKTWEEPRILGGNAVVEEGKKSGGAIASWAFPMVSKSGRIYILYNQFVPGNVSAHRQHTGLMRGIFSDDGGQTWSEPETIPIPRTKNDSSNPEILPEWVVWQRPLRLASEDRYLVGMTRQLPPEFHHERRSAVEFLRFDNLDDDPPVRDLSVSWFARNDDIISVGLFTEEPSVVKLPDGRLFALLRTGMGSPYWILSGDGGQTWSKPEPLLDRDGGKPFLHPVAPCPIYDRRGNLAASGEYFAFVHNAYDFNDPNPWQNRGPLYLIAGRYREGARQPIWFESKPKLFADRPTGQAFYSSATLIDGVQVFWYGDQKFYLLGKKIDDSWFDEE